MGKGKSIRQIHHFTDGLWGPDMDSRADLQSSVNSCRKLENFQVDQYGEAIRRPGFEFIGGALGECLIIDPLSAFPSWAELTDEESITPNDQYGSKGPSAVRFIDHPSEWWLTCDWLVHCYGPEVENVGMQSYLDIYTTRWHAKLEEGLIYYGIVGEPWQQAPVALYPSALPLATGLGFAMDADGKPVFATQIGSNVEIRRFVSGTPTTYTFSGASPKLYLNASIQPDIDLWDVVCYYCVSGDLRERFQRDNFNVAYNLYHSATKYISKIKCVEHGIIDGEMRKVYISATGSLGLRALFRTDDGPVFPSHDTASLPILIVQDGIYDRVIFESSASDSISDIGISISPSGDYQPITVTSSESDSSSVGLSINSSGSYEESAIVTGPYSEPASFGIEINALGDYVIGAIDGGSYSESATGTISINSNGDYSV